MKGRTRLVVLVAVVVAVVAVPLAARMMSAGAEASQPSAGVVANANAPRFVSFNTTTCAPCKAMLRVMEDLEKTYPGRLTVEFVNVTDDNSPLAKNGIQVIPAQIFYSPDGKEIFRHTGVFAAGDVAAKWKELGYDLDAPAAGR